MAEGGKRELFRKKSLERLSSPERLDQLLHVVDRKNWVPLLSVAMLSASLLAWAIFGWIPINVEGRGILIRPRRIVEIQSPGEGRLVSLRVEIDDVVHKGEVLAIIARPDLEEQLRIQKQKQAELAVKFDSIHSVERALEVGSLEAIVEPEDMRRYLIGELRRAVVR